MGDNRFHSEATANSKSGELHAQDLHFYNYFSKALDREQPYRALVPTDLEPGEKLPLIGLRPCFQREPGAGTPMHLTDLPDMKRMSSRI